MLLAATPDIFQPKPFNYLHTIWIHSSSLQFHCQCCPFQPTQMSPRLPHPWILHINSNTPTEPFPLFLQQWAPGSCCIAMGSAGGIVKNWGYPKCHWSLLNGLQEYLWGKYPVLVIFPLCRMKIHKLKGKTTAKPEIFPLLAGIGQLAKVT